MMYCTPIGGDCSFEERKFLLPMTNNLTLEKTNKISNR